MECAENWRPVVVRGEVRPALDARVHGAGDFEEDAAGEGECDVAEDGADALELRVEIVQETGAEW
tara:strand:+ start:8680 stop:8874 length:195 start_codon:yes stop_codon:yes gene_type:complete